MLSEPKSTLKTPKAHPQNADQLTNGRMSWTFRCQLHACVLLSPHSFFLCTGTQSISLISLPRKVGWRSEVDIRRCCPNYKAFPEQTCHSKWFLAPASKTGRFPSLSRSHMKRVRFPKVVHRLNMSHCIRQVCCMPSPAGCPMQHMSTSIHKPGLGYTLSTVSGLLTLFDRMFTKRWLGGSGAWERDAGKNGEAEESCGEAEGGGH